MKIKYLFFELLLLLVVASPMNCQVFYPKSNWFLNKYDNYVDRNEDIEIFLKKCTLNYIDKKKIRQLNTELNIVKAIVLRNNDPFFNFLCNQELISGWYLIKNHPDSLLNINKNNTRENRERNFNKSDKSLVRKFTILGFYPISKNFKSILIQKEYDTTLSKEIIKPMDYNLKTLYLLNYSNLHILSIIEIASHYSGEDELNEYSVYKGNANFNYIDSNSKKVLFSFVVEDNGRIRILCPNQ